jgi:hypothetical protein
LLRHEINGHEQREEIIQSSGLNWTIVRAPILTNGDLTKSYRTDFELRSPAVATKLSREDVAHCMLRQLNETRSFGKAISLMHAKKEHQPDGNTSGDEVPVSRNDKERVKQAIGTNSFKI